MRFVRIRDTLINTEQVRSATIHHKPTRGPDERWGVMFNYVSGQPALVYASCSDEADAILDYFEADANAPFEPLNEDEKGTLLTPAISTSVGTVEVQT